LTANELDALELTRLAERRGRGREYEKPDEENKKKKKREAKKQRSK
jgi:hypothetical protein